MRLSRLLEDLDDKDEFASNCGGGCPLSNNPNTWYSEFNRDKDFHQAHIAAHDAAVHAASEVTERSYGNRLWHATYEEVAIKTMEKFGYKLTEIMPLSDMRKLPLENWYFGKVHIKEDLDDKDEFGSPIIAIGKLIEVNNYDGTYWKLNFDRDVVIGSRSAPRRQYDNANFKSNPEIHLKPGEDYRIFTTNPSVYGDFPRHIRINGTRFDVEVIMDMDKMNFHKDGDITEVVLNDR